MIGVNRRTGLVIDGADHLRQSIEDILSTPVGTRVGRRDYGSLLPRMLGQPLNAAGRIRLLGAAALALLRQEERARIARVTVLAGERPGAAVIRVEGRRTDVMPARPFTFDLPVSAFV